MFLLGSFSSLTKKSVYMCIYLNFFTDSRPFDCKKCGKAYKHRPNLYRHIKYECDGVPKFVCKFCGKAYTQNSSLRNHVNVFHNKLLQ